ncbi:MAG: phosphotransferase [Anaerolineales bacterium]
MEFLKTINHGDFHDGNVSLVKDGRITLFDWGDACIAHPFISVRTFFVSIEIALELDDYSFTPEMQEMLDIYFVPWQKFASKERLQEAYLLSRCVASIVKALMWRQTVALPKGQHEKNMLTLSQSYFENLWSMKKVINKGMENRMKAVYIKHHFFQEVSMKIKVFVVFLIFTILLTACKSATPLLPHHDHHWEYLHPWY